jgi:hypothetical protein
MAASLVELSDAASVDRAARALFGSSLDTRPAVSHSAAVWRADEEEPVTSIRINEHGPKSDLDFLALHIGRARADGIIITGKILREEPALTYDLRADPRWGDALVSWRERRDQPRRNRLRPPDLSRRREAAHLHDRPRRLAQARRSLLPSRRRRVRAIQHLQVTRGCDCVSIEAGPSTARALYERPMLVKELLLSVYLEASLDERAKGAPLVKLSEVRRLFHSETSATHRESGKHWSFHRLRR